MRKIWLSFDYELFLGAKSGTPAACMLLPTQNLIQVLHELHMKATFFVDASYLLRLKDEKSPECQADFQAISSQLRELVRRGHRVELHLHPHWIDAHYQGGGQWTFPHYEHYQLNSLAREKALEHFAQGVEILSHIIQSEFPHYRLRAFRAGGLCATPFELFARAMTANHLDIDSSVAPGLRLQGATHSFDYSSLTQITCEPYTFTSNPLQAEPGKLWEIPILCYKQNLLQKLLLNRKAKGQKSSPCAGDGQGIANFKNRGIGDKLSTSYNPWTIDLALEQIYQDQWKLCNGSGSLLCHPKNLNAQSFQALQFLSKQENLLFLSTEEL